MTIATAQDSVTLLGNSSTVDWDFDFPTPSTEEIYVIYTAADGTQTALDVTDYDIVLNPVQVGALWSVGGTVTYPTSGPAIGAGTTITIYRELPITQNVSLNNQGNQYPKVTERGLDTLCMEIQQLASSVTRSIQVPIVDINPTVILPAAAARAGKYLYFDASGNVTVSDGTDSGSINPLAPYFTPTGSSLPTSGNGLYAPSSNVIGIASYNALCAAFANVASSVNYFQFAGSATATPAYNTMSVLGTDSKVGIIYASKGTSTSGGQFYGNQMLGRHFFTINGANALEITDDWWNPNGSYQGATTAWPVISSGALAGGPDNIAVIGCNSSIYPATATGVTLMYCSRGPTGAHHFTSNGLVAHVNIAGVTNPLGDDTYNTANAIWMAGKVAGTGQSPVIFTQKSVNPADAAVGLTFYNSGAGGFGYYSDNVATKCFEMYRTASAANNPYSKPAAAGGITYMGAEGETNAAFGITSKGSGDVRIQTNTMAALQLIVPHTANAVNAISITGAASSSRPVITVGGASSDTHCGLDIKTKGTSARGIYFYDAGALQMGVFGASTSTSYFNVSGGVNAVSVSAQSGTNPTLTLYTIGTGSIILATNNTANVLMTLANGGDITANTGNLVMGVASKGLVLKQGANGKCGTFVLTGTTPVTVNNTSVVISDAIILSLNTVGGTVGAPPSVKTITAGVGFTVSGTAGDTSTFNYSIISNAA